MSDDNDNDNTKIIKRTRTRTNYYQKKPESEKKKTGQYPRPRKRSRPYRRRMRTGNCSLCGEEMLTMQMKVNLICGNCNVLKVKLYKKEVNASFDPYRFD